MGTHDKKADEQRGCARGQHGDRQRPPQAHRLALRCHESQRVASDAEIGRMAQRDEAGDALQQVQTHRKNRQNHHAGEHLDVEITADEGERQ